MYLKGFINDWIDKYILVFRNGGSNMVGVHSILHQNYRDPQRYQLEKNLNELANDITFWHSI